MKVLAGWLLVVGIGVLFVYVYEAFPNAASTYAEGRLLVGGWIVLAMGVIGLLYSSIKAAGYWLARQWRRGDG